MPATPTPPPADRPATPAGRRPRRARDDDGPVLPPDSHDDRDAGWGDGPGERDGEWYRRERPPHHE